MEPSVIMKSHQNKKNDIIYLMFMIHFASTYVSQIFFQVPWVSLEVKHEKNSMPHRSNAKIRLQPAYSPVATFWCIDRNSQEVLRISVYNNKIISYSWTGLNLMFGLMFILFLAFLLNFRLRMQNHKCPAFCLMRL